MQEALLLGAVEPLSHQLEGLEVGATAGEAIHGGDKSRSLDGREGGTEGQLEGLRRLADRAEPELADNGPAEAAKQAASAWTGWNDGVAHHALELDAEGVRESLDEVPRGGVARALHVGDVGLRVAHAAR